MTDKGKTSMATQGLLNITGDLVLPDQNGRQSRKCHSGV